MESLQGLVPYIAGPVGGLVALLFGYVLVLRGHLVPGNMHREVVTGYQERLKEKDQRIASLEAAAVEDKRRGDIAVEAARASRDMLLGFQQAARPLPSGGVT